RPRFNVPEVERASQDRFFLGIETRDPDFNRDQTRAFRQSLSPLSIAEVPEGGRPRPRTKLVGRDRRARRSAQNAKSFRMRGRWITSVLTPFAQGSSHLQKSGLIFG